LQALAVKPKDLAFSETEGSVSRLRQGEINVFKDVQSVTFGRQVVEALVFQGEFEENVSGSKPKEQRNEANSRRKNAGRQEHRHEIEAANTSSHCGEQSAAPFEQEQLKPGIPKFVSEQDSQCYSSTDQITERPGFVSEYKHFVRHKVVAG
jgi:hypothetical protein